MLKFVKWLSISLLIITMIGITIVSGIYFYLSRGLPKIASLDDYRPPVITTVYSDNNTKIGEFYRERRIIVPFSEIPKMLVYAFIAAEDARFFQHKGIDIFSIIRAFFKNLEAGEIVQGGSTITQQVTKSLFLTPERSYTRKIREAILAYRIEKYLSKREILYLYLNQIYLGHGAYGVEAASENYFNKSVKDLDLSQCALLAGLPRAPSRDSPLRSPKRARQRQIYVLNRMVQEHYISRHQAEQAIGTDIQLSKEKRNWYIEEAPFYTEHIRREVEKKYGVDALYTGGLKIYTAVNLEMQNIALTMIKKGLRELDKRQGYRGSLKQLLPGEIEDFSKNIEAELAEKPFSKGDIVKGVVVSVNDNEKKVSVRLGREMGLISIEDMSWARKPDTEVPYNEVRIEKPSSVLNIGDVIIVEIKDKAHNSDLWELALEQEPKVQAALLCIENKTGHVKAIIGGRNFKESQFNRAIQSRRQPGSAFKPIIYAAALDKKPAKGKKRYTAATIIYDSPVVFEDIERDFTWKPKNYGKTFHGPTLLREAMEKSRNVVTVKILESIGIDYAIDYARKLGITSHLSENLSIALGSSGVSLLELAKSYSIFANSGILIEPVFITKIEDRDGNIIEEKGSEKKIVIKETTAYIMTSLLQGVVKHGTGWRIRALKRPVAGKTGTTNNLYDAWFLGYTPRYVTGVWVGFDDEGSLGIGETGARAASPIWLYFMEKVLKDKSKLEFQIPKGIVFSRIDADTGLLPIPESKNVIFECFEEGTVPTEYTKRPQIISEPEELFKKEL